MLRRTKSENPTPTTAPALTPVQQLAELEENEHRLAAQKAQLRREIEEQRVADARRDIRAAIETSRKAVGRVMERKKTIEDELDRTISHAISLASEASKTTDETATLIEDTIVHIKELGADSGEVEQFRNSLATATPNSRTGFVTVNSSRPHWQEVFELDLVDRPPSWKDYRFANRLVLVATKRN
ncbi:MAG: hypothetical protein V7641_2884 [Blastocatellia bacterium]